MNDQNPASRLPPALLPHVHLVSSYRWPVLPSLSIETVVEYLLQAPKITREVSAMAWTFLNSPPDGTVLLVWQPPHNPRNPSRLPADGYVWGDSEKHYVQQYRGLNLEMYSHKIGFSPPHEAVATHARRRYRLLPGGPNLPPTDPSLWLVHYCRADNEAHLPAHQIPIHPASQGVMHQRRMLQQHGQLMRKEFMLYDRNNWPVINMPGGMAPPQGQVPQGQRMRHASGAMIDQGGPSPKRQRYDAPTQRPGSSRAAMSGPPGRDPVLEDEEEDKDVFDLLTPRDISTMRFTKHQEWMEEIFASPYNSLSIMPVSLGLGRKGELTSLTEGFFDAPTEPVLRDNFTEWSEPLAPGKAEEFTQRANHKIAAINAEMEEMKRIHTKRMANIKTGSTLVDAEKRLRSAATAPGPDKWRLEGGFHTLDGGATDNDSPTASPVLATKPMGELLVEDITRSIEAALNQRVRMLSPFTCVEKGGLEEKAPPPPTPSPAEEEQQLQNGDEDTLMVDGEEFDVGNEIEEFTDIPDLPQETSAEDEEVEQRQDELPQQEQRRYPPASAGPGTLTASSTAPETMTTTHEMLQEANEWVMVDKQTTISPSPALPVVASSSSTMPAAPTATIIETGATAARLGQPSGGEITSMTAPQVVADITVADSAAQEVDLRTDDMIDFGDENDNGNPNPNDIGGEFEDAIDFGTMDSTDVDAALEQGGYGRESSVKETAGLVGKALSGDGEAPEDFDNILVSAVSREGAISVASSHPVAHPPTTATALENNAAGIDSSEPRVGVAGFNPAVSLVYPPAPGSNVAEAETSDNSKAPTHAGAASVFPGTSGAQAGSVANLQSIGTGADSGIDNGADRGDNRTENEVGLGDLETGMDMDMELDDTAFGDAFHHSDAETGS